MPPVVLNPASPTPPSSDVARGQHDVDVTFQVPFRHRLRFTNDVLGTDAGALLDVLEPVDQRVRVLLVVDDGVARADPDVLAKLDALTQRHADRLELAGPILHIAGGEACKNSGTATDAVLAAINEANLDRRNYVIVIGGGAVLDAVGYAAATAHRGVRLVRLPTTTLAQDDSGVGVKNAVNHFGKKNWLGTFAVPWAVLNDAALLRTLPDADFRAGFSEAVKVALLKDAAFFDELCASARAIAARDPAASQSALRQSARLHLDHITRGGDPFETREARPLDFGHWSAHKLEPMTGFRVAHGVAVAAGLAIDCLYSQRMFGFADAPRVLDCLRDLKLPLSHPMLARTDELLSGLEEFRQHLGGRLTITMLRGIGDPIDVHAIDTGVMRQCIDKVRELAGDR